MLGEVTDETRKYYGWLREKSEIILCQEVANIVRDQVAARLKVEWLHEHRTWRGFPTDDAQWQEQADKILRGI